MQCYEGHRMWKLKEKTSGLLCHDVVRVPLSHNVRKTIIVQIYDDVSKYVTPDSMSHLPPDKNRLHSKQSAQSVKEHIAEYKIDNRSFYDIVGQTCKDTDLYP